MADKMQVGIFRHMTTVKDMDEAIQLYEDPGQPAIPHWTSIPGMPKGDFRSPEQKAFCEKSYK